MSDCGGSLDQSNPINLQVSCHSMATFYPCTKCGRIHYDDGEMAFNRAGHAAYFEDGHVVNKDEHGIIQSIL
ncbi:MAG TPA: hypothetical protein DEB13_03450 [Candidatus Yanofskybacteria bacterium]|nr:hypothetical protein [Candidatus Yanofskybacteria bacterium]